ncbi:MAG: phosphate acyltransferase PlsX [bacterium]
MRIVIDAMGGDRAPEDILEGVRLFRKEDEKTELVLVGQQDRLRDAAASLNCELVHAPTVVGMHESPSAVVKSKRDSSIAVAIQLVKEKRGDIVISMGNSGAATAFAFFVLGRLPGVSRPCICTLMPTSKDQCLLADVGATVDCKPQHLLEWAVLGTVYIRDVMRRENPRVGLLSIGEEKTKGNELIFAAGPMLASSGLNYIGHVEGVDITNGKADVVVCDGFVGNVVLKFGEGMVELFFTMLRSYLSEEKKVSNSNSGLVNEFIRQCDYTTHGVAPLLGVNGHVMIGHGRSQPGAIASAIRTARETARHANMIDSMREELERVLSVVAIG